MLHAANPSSAQANPPNLLHYPALLASCQQKLNQLRRHRRGWMWARIGFAAIPLLAFFYTHVLPVNAWQILIVVGVIGFIWAWLRDLRTSKQLQLAEQQRILIQQEINYLQHHEPPPYKSPTLPNLVDHHYAPDLDIVGPHALFHHLSRAQHEPTQSLLMHWLLEPADANTIQNRQSIARQWATDPDWLNRFQAQCAVEPVSIADVDRIGHWCTNAHLKAWQHIGWRVLAYGMPVLTVGSIVAEWLGWIPYPARNGVLLASGILAFYLSRKTNHQHQALGKLLQAVRAFRETMPLLQKAPLPSSALQATSADQAFRQVSADSQEAIAQLTRILEHLDMRYNVVVYPPLAVLFQWDLQQALALSNWAGKHQKSLPGWMDTLLQAEALVSLAAWKYHHPDYTEPVLTTGPVYIEAEQLGHPLLKQNGGVRQSVEVMADRPLLLITGSNMAGKSTFLRSVGVNLILAYAGAVVCAKNFTCQQLQVTSSMRIADNLVESTSTFWAELKRIGRILDLARSQQPILILLDEILRGTNSQDQHLGTKALLEQLMRLHVPVIVASHDVALAQELQEKYPAIQLAYFDATLDAAGQLHFDYQKKPGICSSFNASALMAQMGIEL